MCGHVLVDSGQPPDLSLLLQGSCEDLILPFDIVMHIGFYTQLPIQYSTIMMQGRAPLSVAQLDKGSDGLP